MSGSLAIIGLGPGEAHYLTPSALAALEAASDLVFSPDSKQFVYSARLNGAAMVMLDNSRGTDGVPTIPVKPFFYGLPTEPKVAWIESKNSNDMALVMANGAAGNASKVMKNVSDAVSGPGFEGNA